MTQNLTWGDAELDPSVVLQSLASLIAHGSDEGLILDGAGDTEWLAGLEDVQPGHVRLSELQTNGAETGRSIVVKIDLTITGGAGT